MLGVLCAGPAAAWEALDGKIQAHGYYEAQLRVVSADYADDWDLTQWYNVFNLELEFDFAPDGVGPFDLVQGFVRLEARYDCIYSRGCGFVRGADAYGDRAKDLPKRLSNARQSTYHGAVELDEIRTTRFDWKTFTRDFDDADGDNDPTTGSFETQAAMSIREEITRNGQAFNSGDTGRGLLGLDDTPGFSGLGSQVGADKFVGRAPCFEDGNPECGLSIPGNDPAVANFQRVGGPTSEFVRIDGKRVPIDRRALIFKGLFTPRSGEFAFFDDDPFPNVFGRFLAGEYKFTAIQGRGGGSGGLPITSLGPWLPKNDFIETGMLADVGNPFDNTVNTGSVSTLFQAAAFNGTVYSTTDGIAFDPNNVTIDRDAPDGIRIPFGSQLPLTRDLLGEHLQSFSVPNDFFSLDEIQRNAGGGQVVSLSGGGLTITQVDGEFQKILEPENPSRFTTAKPFRAIPWEDEIDLQFFADREAFAAGYASFAALVATGTPEQIAAIRSAAGIKFQQATPQEIGRLAMTTGAGAPRGLYLPSRAHQQLLAEGVGKHPFNIDETDRAWNRGESQDDEGELKEAFLDIEMFDHQLWLRLGKQNIVWGKTELFRTTDQFNPQDLGLAVLPNLEESRIALWSARAVYSLYDVGNLRDVRLELAANLDDNEPADLGACGEPYAPLPVCIATFGLFAHGTTGIGLAGVEKPPSPWEDSEGWEVGGRLEWRWGRYSFALADFYGYDDLPFIDVIGLYERNVDFDTGRPRAYGATGPCRTQPIAARQAAAANSPLGFDSNGMPLYTPDRDCLQAGPTQQQAYQFSDIANRGRLQDGISNIVQAGLFLNPRTIASNEFLGNPLARNNDGALIFDESLIVDATTVDLTSYAGLVRDPNSGAIWDPSSPATARGSLTGNALIPGDLTLDVGRGSYSPNNSIVASPGNQQLFGVICGSTIGVSTVDTAACAATVFGSGKPIEPFGFTAGQFIAGALAGQVKGQQNDNVNQTLGAAARFEPATRFAIGDLAPLVRINRDIGDGEAEGTSNAALALALANPDNHGCVDSSIWYLIPTNPTRGANFPTGQTAAGETISLIPCHSGGGGVLANFGRGLGQHLSVEQQALLGCGAYYGTNCDDSGIDLFNMEASTIVQSWVGFEGTTDPAGVNFRTLFNVPGAAAPVLWSVNNRKSNGMVNGRPMILDGQDREQPGTVFFRGGPVATFYDRATNSLKQLPGTRGLIGDPTTRQVSLDPNWDASVDGCVVTGAGLSALNANSGNTASAADLARLAASCDGADVRGLQRRDLTHPLANISPVNQTATGGPARGVLEPGAIAQNFRSEMAAVSFSFMSLLAALDSEFEEQYPFALCQPLQEDVDSTIAAVRANPRCARDGSGAEIRTCSLATPQFCGNVRGIMLLTGVQRNIVRAGGDGTFGRRTFLWHSGGEAVLRYNKRNVLGFSVDFAEDITKSNFSIESTWIEGVKRSDPNSFTGVGTTDDINVTLSMDRPTFVNFLNANRTIFFNAQFFFQYRIGHEAGLGGPNGPWNLLLTFTAFTGYFQDRLMPRFTLIYDVQSQSGGALTEISFRFNEAFSIILGTQSFWGRTQFNPIPLANIAPASNHQGRHAYQTGGVTGAGIVRDMDGAFLRLRYVF